jgi:hypothetical protein
MSFRDEFLEYLCQYERAFVQLQVICALRALSGTSGDSIGNCSPVIRARHTMKPQA